MPNRFDPKKMVAKIRKKKYFNAIHKEKLEKLLNETDNFTNYREEHRRRLTQLNATTSALDNYHRTKKLKKGGSVPRSRKPKKVVDENKAMVLSQNKAIAHHTDELKTAINKSDKKVEAWVVGKVERASTDISDVTHYLEGQTEYAEGGKIAERYFVVETFPNGRKRKLMDYPDYDTAEVYARMKTNFRNKGNVITIENSKSEVMKQFKKGGHLTEKPLLGKNGERRIDAEAIERLEMLARELKQTKYMYLDKNNNYLPERKKLHDQIIESFKKDKPCVNNRQPVAILTGGAPASGKSTFISKYVDLDPDKIYHIDADEVRSRLPEYKGWNASQTHLETNDITTQLIDTIGEPCEFDLIYDGTMNRSDKYTTLVDKLHLLGYKVFIIYISIPKELSIKRSRERYKKSGRYVPQEVIDKVYSSGLDAFEDVAKNMADGYVRIDGVSGDIIEKGGMSMPKNIEYSKGGQVGDNALVLSANKMGYITEVGNGTYTLRFPEGTQSVFKASELQIMKDDEFAKGGDLDKDYKEYEMVVVTSDVKGKFHNYRFLVVAKTITEAKKIATDLWNKNFSDMDEKFHQVMTDYKYRMDYGMADGGEVEGVDLFEDYEDQPKEVEAIISKYEIEDYNYDVLQQMKEELESIGYTMDYGLDAEPIDLRKIGQRGKSEFYAKGGETSKYNYGRSWHMDKRKFNKSEDYELPMNTRKKAMGGMTEYVGMTDGGRYNIVDDGKVVETNVTYSKVIDYANTIAFYDIMDESDMGEVNEIANFEEAVNYLGMVDVEVVQVGADGMAVPNKTQYFIENMGSLKGDVEFILEMNDVNYNTKGEDFILLTTPDKIKFIVSDIEDIDDPKAHDIVVRTINNVLHGTYVEPTKKRFTEGMSEKTAEKILKKLGVVGNAPTNEKQKARSQANNGLVLFTPEIDKKLFEQYKFGSDLDKQDVVVKIFNPYGQGTWYIMNADPDEPDYMWGIVDLFETEMGSMSRDELVSLRISPLKFKLERDISFKPTNAKVIFDGLMDGKHFKFGGNVTYNTEKYFDQEIH